MKKRYAVIAILLMFIGMVSTKALTVGDCKVLVSFKLNSSLDEDSYICKGTSYGNENEKIYYNGNGNEISLNNFEAYYFTNWDEDVVLNIKGKNNISLLHVSDISIKVKGSGLLKFKQSSFVKKVVNGEAVYQFLYNNKLILADSKKIYEGTTEEFINNYDNLKEFNKLPKEYIESDYELNQVEDYEKMTSLPISNSWFKNNISTDLKTTIEDGYGVIKYVAPVVKKEPTAKKEENILKTDNVVLISQKKVDKKYKLKEKNLKSTKVANKVSKSLKENKNLVSLYDVSVYKGTKIVEMKDGKYTIKIKLDEPEKKYENYQIIYVNDAGEIEEYIDGVVENGYVVFETTHLSQYGVIANQVSVKGVSIDNSVKTKISSKLGLAFKLSILGGFVLVTLGMLSFLEYKSKHIKKRTRKRAS